MSNISLDVNCAAKRSQNLQKSEFKQARENSNIRPKVSHFLKMAQNCKFCRNFPLKKVAIQQNVEILMAQLFPDKYQSLLLLCLRNF